MDSKIQDAIKSFGHLIKSFKSIVTVSHIEAFFWSNWKIFFPLSHCIVQLCDLRWHAIRLFSHWKAHYLEKSQFLRILKSAGILRLEDCLRVLLNKSSGCIMKLFGTEFIAAPHIFSPSKLPRSGTYLPASHDEAPMMLMILNMGLSVMCHYHSVNEWWCSVSMKV